jgi:hypothetical protein
VGTEKDNIANFNHQLFDRIFFSPKWGLGIPLPAQGDRAAADIEQYFTGIPGWL